MNSRVTITRAPSPNLVPLCCCYGPPHLRGEMLCRHEKGAWRRRLRAWWDDWSPLFAGLGMLITFIVIGLGTLFGFVYLVVLAVRLAWGS